MMLRKITHRLPINLYEDLRDEALKYRISISDVIRGKLLASTNPDPKKEFAEKQELEKSSASEQTKQTSEIYLMTLEILLLLREFIFERNAQILKRVDEKMERRFGKDRKKIL
jgi:hypothetical protein